MKRIHHKIANKLILGFITLTLISSLITGIIYIQLFYRSHIETKSQTLRSYAYELEKLIQKSTQTSLDTLELYDEVLDSRVWILQKNLPPLISSGHSKTSHSGKCHTTSSCKIKGYDHAFIQTVFEGEVVVSKSNNQFYYGPTLSVGIPIHRGDTITGAILIHTPILELYEPIIKASLYLLLSLSASVFFTFILARKYAIDFTSSIRKLQHTASIMTSGDYTVRTEITRQDEIGDLSHSLDLLAVKLYEASLESDKLQQIRQDFVANVSHEFRTPLTIIKGNTEALIDGALPSSDCAYQNILKETLILEALVKDLLDLSRIEQNKLEFSLEPIALQEVIRDALRSIRQVAHTKSIHIDLSLSEEATPIISDYYRLRQVLVIFLDNAVKYTPLQGTIQVNLTSTATHFILQIQDFGIGIPPEDLPYIWDRFYKASTTDPHTKSTGLGLAIAKQLMQLLDIGYTVSSTVGIGTSITLTFSSSNSLSIQ